MHSRTGAALRGPGFVLSLLHAPRGSEHDRGVVRSRLPVVARHPLAPARRATPPRPRGSGGVRPPRVPPGAVQLGADAATTGRSRVARRTTPCPSGRVAAVD